MIKKPKSAIYWNMRRQGASGQDACRKVMQSGGPDKANPFTLNKCLGEMKRQLSVGKSTHKQLMAERLSNVERMEAASDSRDKAKRFREASVSTRKKHYRELQWHANDEESVGKNVENREYKHLKRQYKKD